MVGENICVQIGEKKSKLISDLCMAEGEISGREKIFLVGHSAPAEYVDVYIWSEHMHRLSIQREQTHRPYVHYFRSFVFSCIFIKLLTELF